jgi:hypothetical protein
VFNYIKSAGTARKLLTNFGRTIEHIQTVEGSYVPGVGVTNTTTSTNVLAADFDMKGNEYKIDLVQMGDRYALISPDVSNIDVTDKLIIDGVTWNIINVERLSPAGVLVLWKCHIRK